MQLNEAEIRRDVERALREDIGTGDVTAALLPANQQIRAEIICREPMLVAGQAWINEVFHQVDASIQIDWLVGEGEWLATPQRLCVISGLARSILTAERCALNFLQTLSATATQTRQYVDALQGSQTALLDTRKTLPGLRYAQKYAVACAGGINHRLGLYDAYLIKENHIRACGSIGAAIAEARRQHPELFLEIEVESLDELRQALDASPDRILLDNFSPAQLRAAVKMNEPKVCPLEASGGFNLSTIAQVAATGVDYVSVGAITKSIQAIDLSLLVLKD